MADTESWIVDRFEGEWCVVEADGRSVSLPRRFFPPSLGEGDVLEVRVTRLPEHALIEVAKDVLATTERKTRLARTLPRPGKGDPGGDLDL
ncbi:MAG: DUF3006 domain-containing protein [Deltaproteobacteria bacterium]|nr:DUF3006 domain-containing protein [Deltaproteobacteria bacterium]